MAEPKNRRRKRRKVYTKSYDEDEIDDAAVNAELRAFGFFVEDEPDDSDRWGYDLQTKIDCERFIEHSEEIIERLEGKDYNAHYFHEHGFTKPIYFDKSDGLGLVMPSGDEFSVQDVKKLVGANRVIDVVDVKTQKGSQTTLREFVDYFQSSDKTKLLNVLSLEFSKTKLADYVRAPIAVRDLDWVELAWPQDLKEQQTDSTNALNAMKYPKVQNYCLMSVGGCYTDFHVDFGGTSVWYHILRGEKIFWLIPPTEVNCQHFQSWTLSGRQHKTFFGDLVEQCVRVKLKAGDTFMIPSGWFHAVYTPVDSLVFGGNFLHSFAIPMQLSVYEIERNTHVPLKFQYPFFMEMQWYVLERYYAALTGGSFLRRPEDNVTDVSSIQYNSDEYLVDKEISIRKENAFLLSNAELDGLRTLVNWLQSLSNSKRRVPDRIERPDVLLRKSQELLCILERLDRKPSDDYYTVLSVGRPQIPFTIQQMEPSILTKPAIRHVYKKRIKLEEPAQAELSEQERTKSDQDIKELSTPRLLQNEAASTSFFNASPSSTSGVRLSNPFAVPRVPIMSRSNTAPPVQRTQSSSFFANDVPKSTYFMSQPVEPLIIIPGDMVPAIGAECIIETNSEPI